MDWGYKYIVPRIEFDNHAVTTAFHEFLKIAMILKSNHARGNDFWLWNISKVI